MRTRLRRRLPVFVTLVLAVAVGLVVLACGSDEGTRGLQPADETSTPESNAEDAMSEAERQKQQAMEMQQAHAEELEQAEEH